MINKKSSVFALLEILTKDSDENHPLKEPEIRKKIEMVYGLKIDRRTLYANVKMLKSFGIDIATYSETGTGYYLRDRQFEPSEVFLLCNAIHSSSYIPNKQSKDLIKKLLSTQSRYYIEDYRNQVYLENKDKKDNKEFFYCLEVLSNAISKKKCVAFDYMTYNTNKELVKKREEPYKVVPYYLIYADEKTYLIAKSLNHLDNGFIHFRVDKIKNIELIDDKYIRLSKSEDPYKYAKNKVYMYHGDENRIVIKCDNKILDDIIDRFGKDIRIEPLDDNHFLAYVKSSAQGMVYFALQYLNYLEVLEPKNIRDEIKRTLKEGNKKYK